MKFASIARHLRPYRMVTRRRTTINHMFAAAISPNDPYEVDRVRKAVTILENDPERDLECAYCGAPAETWDHIYATVKDSRFSGYGHRIGNLLPCCKPCNSKKGNKAWDRHLASLPLTDAERRVRSARIKKYLAAFLNSDQNHLQTDDHHMLDEIRETILTLMAEADLIAERIRSRHISNED